MIAIAEPCPEELLAHRAVVESVSTVLLDELGKRVEPGSRLALLDFPNHGNVGDSAIWCGERETLRRLGAHIVYTATARGANLDVCRERTASSGVVLFHGGGNFGDLWHEAQEFRISAIERLRDRRIIILPQDLHFTSPEGLARTRDVCRSHGRVTVFTRSARSTEVAQQLGAAEVVEAVDAAMILTAPRVNTTDTGMLTLSRRDIERSDAEWPADLRTVDWPGLIGRYGEIEDRALIRALSRASGGAGAVRAFDMVASRRLRRGWRALLGHRLVCTDRLHAVLMSLLGDRRCIAVDNNYGKVHGVLRAAGLVRSPLLRLAESKEEAVMEAEKWLRA